MHGVTVCATCGDGTGCEDGCTVTAGFLTQLEAAAELIEHISTVYYGAKYADHFRWDAYTLRYEANYLRSHQ